MSSLIEHLSVDAGSWVTHHQALPKLRLYTGSGKTLSRERSITWNIFLKGLEVSEIEANEILTECVPILASIGDSLCRQLMGELWAQVMKPSGRCHYDATPPWTDKKKKSAYYSFILPLYVWTYEKHNVAYIKCTGNCDYVFLCADNLPIRFPAQPPSWRVGKVAWIIFDFDAVSPKLSLLKAL